jgi:hypothetical protein
MQYQIHSVLLIVSGVLLAASCAQDPVDIQYFTRQFGATVPSAHDLVAVRSPSDAFGDYSFAMTFHANDTDISNILVHVASETTNAWSVLESPKVFSAGKELTSFEAPLGSLYIADQPSPGRSRATAIDTNNNQVFFVHHTW